MARWRIRTFELRIEGLLDLGRHEGGEIDDEGGDHNVFADRDEPAGPADGSDFQQGDGNEEK